MSGDQAPAVAADPENIRSDDGKFVPGKSGNPAGRPKGIPNKSTQLLKDAILLAAQRAGGGDEDGIASYLETQAKENPGPFMALLGKVLPMTVGGDPNNPIVGEVRITLVDPSA